MKYLTADLLQRCASNDDAIADQAQVDWDAAQEAYRTHLEGMKELLPPGCKNLIDAHYLHDAEVVLMASERLSCEIALQLGAPQSSGVCLDYALTEPVPLDDWRRLIIERKKDRPLIWLYDELQPGVQPGTFVHSILFNLLEISIPFTDLRYREMQKLFAPAAINHDLSSLTTPSA